MHCTTTLKQTQIPHITCTPHHTHSSVHITHITHTTPHHNSLVHITHITHTLISPHHTHHTHTHTHLLVPHTTHTFISHTHSLVLITTHTQHTHSLVPLLPRIQGAWRGHKVRMWYREHRRHVPPRDPSLRRRYFEQRLTSLTDQLVGTCSSGTSGVEGLLTRVEQNMAASRDVARYGGEG